MAALPSPISTAVILVQTTIISHLGETGALSCLLPPACLLQSTLLSAPKLPAYNVNRVTPLPCLDNPVVATYYACYKIHFPSPEPAGAGPPTSTCGLPPQACCPSQLPQPLHPLPLLISAHTVSHHLECSSPLSHAGFFSSWGSVPDVCPETPAISVSRPTTIL